MCHPWLPLALAWTVLPGVALGAADDRAHEVVFEHFKDSVVTVEVFPLSGEAKSALGSGYVVAQGHIVTNYHVVGSYILHPERCGLRIKNGRGPFPAKLIAFDLVNDLALLEAPVTAAALRLAADSGRPGAPIIAFGNPEGLGLSLVEGVFNGFAEKGFIAGVTGPASDLESYLGRVRVAFDEAKRKAEVDRRNLQTAQP